mgnify:FL=1
MKKLFTLFAAVASLLAISCEGGFDLSGILGDYVGPIIDESLFETDEEGRYIIPAEGTDIEVDLSILQEEWNMDITADFDFNIKFLGEEEGWLTISNLEDIQTEGKIIVYIEENTSTDRRYADIEIRPAENDFFYYPLHFVQEAAEAAEVVE